MLTQRQVVDYALRRRSLLAAYRAGRVDASDVCDAGSYLLEAAKFHGSRATGDCPVCRKPALTLVCWVYGEELRHASGSARAGEELARMANLFREFTVYEVEVCRSCRWNHLTQSYVLGTGAPTEGGRTRSRRTAER